MMASVRFEEARRKVVGGKKMRKKKKEGSDGGGGGAKAAAAEAAARAAIVRASGEPPAVAARRAALAASTAQERLALAEERRQQLEREKELDRIAEEKAKPHLKASVYKALENPSLDTASEVFTEVGKVFSSLPLSMQAELLRHGFKAATGVGGAAASAASAAFKAGFSERDGPDLSGLGIPAEKQDEVADKASRTAGAILKSGVAAGQQLGDTSRAAPEALMQTSAGAEFLENSVAALQRWNTQNAGAQALFAAKAYQLAQDASRTAYTFAQQLAFQRGTSREARDEQQKAIDAARTAAASRGQAPPPIIASQV